MAFFCFNCEVLVSVDSACSLSWQQPPLVNEDHVHFSAACCVQVHTVQISVRLLGWKWPWPNYLITPPVFPYLLSRRVPASSELLVYWVKTAFVQDIVTSGKILVDTHLTVCRHFSGTHQQYLSLLKAASQSSLLIFHSYKDMGGMCGVWFNIILKLSLLKP